MTGERGRWRDSEAAKIRKVNDSQGKKINSEQSRSALRELENFNKKPRSTIINKMTTNITKIKRGQPLINSSKTTLKIREIMSRSVTQTSSKT